MIWGGTTGKDFNLNNSNNKETGENVVKNETRNLYWSQRDKNIKTSISILASGA